MFIKTSLWQMLSTAMQNLATYCSRVSIWELTGDRELFYEAWALMQKNGEMRLVQYFCTTIFCVESQALCLDRESSYIALHYSLQSAWHHARISNLQCLGSLRLVRYVIGQAEYLLDSLAIKVGSLARSSCYMLFNGCFSLNMSCAE